MARVSSKQVFVGSMAELADHLGIGVFLGQLVDSQVTAVKPVFAHDTLDHRVLDRVLGVGIGASARAVQAPEVLVVPEKQKYSVYVKL